jgi:hypothetical protein
MRRKHPRHGAPALDLQRYHEALADNDLEWFRLSEPIAYHSDGSGSFIEYRVCKTCRSYWRSRPAAIFLVEYADRQLPCAAYLGPVAVPVGMRWDQIKWHVVMLVLQRTGGNIPAAARSLGISRRGLLNMVRAAGIENRAHLLRFLGIKS